MSTLKNNKAKAILDAAAKGGYAVPAVCCYNLEALLATRSAAESLRSPALLLLFPWSYTYSRLALCTLAAHIASSSTVPLAVHLDHAQTPSAVKTAADSGCFDGIMVDMSHYPKDENLALTKELTTYCHERGIAVEAEPGRIEGGEDGVGDTGDLEAVMTDEAEARRFTDTGIDWLAPAFGNVHGNYGARGIKLDYDRLERVGREVGAREEGGVRLVLHGTDGFDEEILGKCRDGGVVKVNINKAVNRHWRREVAVEGGTLTGVMERATEEMKGEVEWWIRALGSEGKA